MHIEYKLKFLLHKRHPDERENLSIRMRVTLRGKTPVDFPTGYKTDVDTWDAQKCRVRDENRQNKEINRLLDEWQSIVGEMVARYEILEKRIPEVGEFRDLFNDMIGRPTRITRMLDAQFPSFFDAFDRFISEQGMQNQWTDGTYEKFRAIRKHLYDFDAFLNWETLNERKMQKYVEFLLHSGMVNTTLSKNLSFVRWFLRWASQHNLYNGKLHETFKPRLQGANGECCEIVYLTRDELKTIETFQFPATQPGMARVRDVFVFCCYSGIRYSDVAKLKRTDIFNDHFRVVTKKTRESLHIELNNHTRAIIDKYKKERIRGGLALPVISNVKMNAALKNIGIECGIDSPTRRVVFKGAERIENVVPKWQLLTTHVARRTFVVMALQLGVPAEVIMKWTGHADYKSMKPYIAIVDELKRTSMDRFNEI